MDEIVILPIDNLTDVGATTVQFGRDWISLRQDDDYILLSPTSLEILRLELALRYER